MTKLLEHALRQIEQLPIASYGAFAILSSRDILIP
jgi:hypothetical protein